MDPDGDAAAFERMAEDRSNYLIPDPLTAEQDRPHNRSNGDFREYNGMRPTSPVNLNNWDWLRLDALGPGWEQALRDVPVNRREALNLLIIMKKKLLRAANELTFYKERVTLLQEQLIYQKKNEEKFIRNDSYTVDENTADKYHDDMELQFIHAIREAE
ncbi:unnamed protein product [Echinostoma caproni]|uniref:Striatin domain-containing protein n=1 Tax=Echinostoma caproni TaxID=27848 RepID=A0A183A5G2_9TREM|nr:unnamed protein product [Echinostoma caproni]